MTDTPSTYQGPADSREPATPGADRQAFRRRLRFLLIVLWLFLGAAVVLAFAWSRSTLDRPSASALPVLHAAPDFSLTNRDGSTVDLARLAGQPWVADFVFTRCPGVCPILSDRMSDLADEVPSDEVRFVSISVDPEHDTPEVLEAYARSHGAGENWFFLTGPKDQVYATIREGFLLALDDSPRQEGGEPIVHSNRYVLVDAENQIRGYYDAFDAEELEQLRVDLRSLLR